MRRACLLLFLSISARAWQEPQSSAELALVTRVRQRMAENLAHLPNYTCLETIERSVRRRTKDNVFRDRVRLEMGFIEARELRLRPALAPIGAASTSTIPLRRAGAFRVEGGSLRLSRGVHLILETQKGNQ